ncbi:Diphthamide biosynthesis protein 1 [Ananas comosus]|uniref:2-(3-amino-3-carboxypropyl)histidine synthase subunit 1 n=1 Tax=Ananas comosus TaxID=4615 RepID=A0A199V0G3_ANACO|nr:Diphthamide biosynthesis protein 1 [Ananas comosus]
MEADDAPSSPSSAPSNPKPNPRREISELPGEKEKEKEKKKKAWAPKRFVHSQIPASILSDPSLNAAISLLPSNYDFEVHKTVHRLRSAAARRVALQLPEGLLMYSLLLADALRSDADDVLVLADPTYGACCVADRAAAALSADLLVHYGHSCLVPVPSSLLPVLYVFVDIRVDPTRLAAAVRSAFPDPAAAPRLALAGTIQFVSAVHAARSILLSDGYKDVLVPQAKPLSPGEVLGCTAPTIPKSEGVDSIIFVADGRFHLEAFMIANPGVRAFRYDPFLGVLVLEEYDRAGMKRARKDAILAARKAKNWGVILGTLGRQGSTKVLDRVVDHMEERGLDYAVVLMSEISPTRIELFGDSVDAWVQIACPRLSIDWGEGFTKPLLTTFEFDIALGYIPGWWEKERAKESLKCDSNLNCPCGAEEDGKNCLGSSGCRVESCSSSNCGNGGEETEYPMDYYAQDGGEWNSSYMKKKPSAGDRKAHSRVGKQPIS